MMLGVSSLMGGGNGGADAHESGGGSGGSSEVGASSSIPGGGGIEDGERSGGGSGNRWPRQETMALLKIRSDMDGTFRDSSLKGPLWEEVSRKMAELGFHRSAKKCKEKFENVYKYHKRTKDGRASKSDGKTYRFFDQLEALENTPPPPFTPPAPRPPPPPMAAVPSMPSSNIITTTSNPIMPTNPIVSSSHFQPPPPPPPQLQPPPQPAQMHTFQRTSFQSNSTSSSSSTSSDEDIQRRRGKKRKWKDFFKRLMKDVIVKQEDLQKKFLDTLEKRERDRISREETWRVQEMARLNREHELLVQERSIAAAKDAAVISFLQKVTEQHNLQIPISTNNTPPPPPPPPQPQPSQPPQQQKQPQQQPPQVQIHIPPPENPTPPPPKPVPVSAPPVVTAITPTKTLESSKTDNGGDNSNQASSSRWPKAEVEALIKLRTNLDLKYQENGPKGPLWEEISSAMAKIGYNRSSKRCKEKWENINKYFKKVKESNRKRPEDSKTCPYFHQLDALYREKAKNDTINVTSFHSNPTVPIMARPEQQWPLQRQPHQADTLMRDREHENDSENNDQLEEDDYGDDDEDDDEGGGNYEIVTNKQPSNTAE